MNLIGYCTYGNHIYTRNVQISDLNYPLMFANIDNASCINQSVSQSVSQSINQSINVQTFNIKSAIKKNYRKPV